MSTFGMNLRVTTDSKQGGRKYMEDMISIKFKKSEDGKNIEYTYLAVFDGHGGSDAAKFAKEHLLDEITKQNGFWSSDDSQVMKAIKDGFLSCHSLMQKNINQWPQTVLGHPSTSGTTVSVVFIKNGKLYIGHVGDSSVVLGLQNKPDNGHISANCVTIDHKPDCPKELKRIQSNGGAVVAKAGVQRVVWNRPKKPHQGPIRRSTAIDKIPFLAIARALGDLWSYNCSNDVYIVSPEPDVSTCTVDLQKHRYIILASDGLWNMVKPQEAVNVVNQLDEQSKDPYNGIKPASVLVRLALDKWAVRNLRADNTSVIVAYLDPPTNSGSTPFTGLCKQPSAASSATTFKLGSDDESLSDLDTSDEDLDLEYDQNLQDYSHLHVGIPKDLVAAPIAPAESLSPPLESFSRNKGVKMSLTVTPPRNNVGKMSSQCHHRFGDPPSSAPPKLHRVDSTQVLDKLPRYSKQQSSPSKLGLKSKSPSKTADSLSSHTSPSSAAKGLCFDRANDSKSSEKSTVHNLRVRKHSASQDDKFAVSPRKHARVVDSNVPECCEKLCNSRAVPLGRQVGSNLTNGSPTRVRSLSVGSEVKLGQQSPAASNTESYKEVGPKQATMAKSPLKVETSALQSPTSAMISPIWPKNLDKDLRDGSLTIFNGDGHRCENNVKASGRDMIVSEPCSSGSSSSRLTAAVGNDTVNKCDVLQENSSSSSSAQSLKSSQKMSSAVKGFLKLFMQGSQNKAPPPLTRGGLKRRASTEGAILPPNAKKMRVLPKVSKLQSKVIQSARFKRKSRGIKKKRKLTKL